MLAHAVAIRSVCRQLCAIAFAFCGASIRANVDFCFVPTWICFVDAVYPMLHVLLIVLDWILLRFGVSSPAKTVQHPSLYANFLADVASLSTVVVFCVVLPTGSIVAGSGPFAFLPTPPNQPIQTAVVVESLPRSLCEWFRCSSQHVLRPTNE